MDEFGSAPLIRFPASTEHSATFKVYQKKTFLPTFREPSLQISVSGTSKQPNENVLQRLSEGSRVTMLGERSMNRNVPKSCVSKRPLAHYVVHYIANQPCCSAV